MDKRIWVAGHRGMVGSAFCRLLPQYGYWNLTTTNLDLRDAAAVDKFVELEKPDLIIMCAGRVGGIGANNQHRVDFIDINLTIGCNVVRAATKHHAELIYLGSTCIYPRDCPQPMQVEHLWHGPLEPTNKWYATAKLAVIQFIEAHARDVTHSPLRATVLIPCNMYGPNDNYDTEKCHVIPALFSKIWEGQRYGFPSVDLLGTGIALREFMHVDDLVSAAMTAREAVSVTPQLLNVGFGAEVTISALAAKIAALVGYTGNLRFSGKLEGTPRKICDSSKLRAMGWTPKIDLDTGLERVWKAIELKIADRRAYRYRL